MARSLRLALLACAMAMPGSLVLQAQDAPLPDDGAPGAANANAGVAQRMAELNEGALKGLTSLKQEFITVLDMTDKGDFDAAMKLMEVIQEQVTRFRQTPVTSFNPDEFTPQVSAALQLSDLVARLQKAGKAVDGRLADAAVNVTDIASLNALIDKYSFLEATLTNVVFLSKAQSLKLEVFKHLEEIEKAQAEVDAEQERIEQLTKEAEAQRKQAEELRTSATQKDRKAEALGGSVEAQRVREQVVSMQGTASVAAAVRATDAKDREVAAKNKEVSDAITAQELLEREKAEVKGKISAAEARKAAAAQSVYDAQGNLDLAKANGKGIVGAQQALISAQRAADGVNREADAAIAAFSESLKSIESKLNIAARIIQQSSKQNNNLLAEMPSGE